MTEETKLQMEGEDVMNGKEGTIDMILEDAILDNLTFIIYRKEGRFALNAGQLFRAEIDRRIAEAKKAKEEMDDAVSEFVGDDKE